MKPGKPFVVAAVILAVLLLLPWLLMFSVDLIAQSQLKTETILTSLSPNAEYSVRVDGRMGTGLLNVPVYITIYGEEMEKNTRCCTVRAYIDNDNGGAYANSNVWMVWKADNVAVVLLMGEEQMPELIEIAFGEETSVTRRQTPETAQEARALLEGFQVDVDAIPERYW